MQVKVITPDSAPTEVLIFPILKDKKLNKTLARIAELSGIKGISLEKNFNADNKEIHSFYGKEGEQIYLVGLGEKPSSNQIIQTCRSFTHHRKSKFPKSISLDFILPQVERLTEEIIIGLVLGTYDINFYQTSKKAKVIWKSIQIISKKSKTKDLERVAKRATKTAATLASIFDLVNKPANKKRPQELADWALQSGKKNGFSVKVLDKPEIEKVGLNALLAVNRGSEDPAKFIIMEYIPKTKKAVKTIGLVGKGVTFDTGGLSIKGSANMHLMKSDMGGSAAVFGAMELVAKLELPIHLVAVVGATDNSVDALSYKPSDVFKSYSGKTIEIIDTDAEGRMTLADGLAYVNKNYKPEILIDVATLTGAVIRALGYFAAGLYTKNDKLAQKLIEAGKETGERLWQLPMWDDYGSMIKSDVADVRNFSGKPIAGSITAAKFLEHHTNEHPQWAHLDIAGTSMTANEFASDRSATGFGVRLLLQFIENISKS